MQKRKWWANVLCWYVANGSIRGRNCRLYTETPNNLLYICESQSYPCTGCPINIVPPGIRFFDMKGPSKNMNSMHLAQRPFLSKKLYAVGFLEATVKNLKFGFSLFHCYATYLKVYATYFKVSGIWINLTFRVLSYNISCTEWKSQGEWMSLFEKAWQSKNVS